MPKNKKPARNTDTGILSVGGIIKLNRIQLRISQEKLCHNLCSVSTLSNIENGVQNPSRIIFESLMERMGLNPGVYPSITSGNDRDAYELKHDFIELYSAGDFENAESVLHKLTALPEPGKQYKHFILMCKTLLKQQHGAPHTEVIAAFEELIEKVIKDFDPSKIRRCVLTKTEISLLNAYAIARHGAGDAETAKHILYELVAYIERNVYDQAGFAATYTQILYNLSKYVGMEGDDDEAIHLCERGIRACIRYGNYRFFPDLLYNKGYGLMRKGREPEAHKCIREAYYLYGALGKIGAKSKEHTRRYADEKGIKLL